MARARIELGGDRERASAVYRGLEPLKSADVAELIAFVTRPAHVYIDYVGIKPTAQATATLARRRTPPSRSPH